MPKYYYSLIDQVGKKTEGTMIASNLEAAHVKLQGDGIIILDLHEEKKIREWFWQQPSLSFEDRLMFTKNLATMIKVGITVSESLKIILNQTKKANNRKMFENILEMLKSGQSLSKSLATYPKIFPEIFVNMIATGEESGNLEQVLERLDIQLEKENEVRKKVISAFIYPALIIGLTLLIGLGIVIFIMPKIVKIFSSFDVELPLPTRIMIGLSNLLTHNLILTFLVLGGSIFGLIMLMRLKITKKFLAKVIMYMPVFGKLIIYSNLARFSRTLNSLLQGGVPIQKALGITAAMIGNHSYEIALKKTKEKVEQGAKLGESLESYPKLFPELATKLLHIGERTGSMEITTERLATLYENNVDSITKNLSVLLEPILLVFMSGMVGGIALSIILPIYKLPNLIQQ